MLKFKSFLKEVKTTELNFEKTVQKLIKTRNSIYSHMRNGGSTKTQRGWELVDRYQDLRSSLRKSKEGYEVWKKYCENDGADVDHNGYDIYAG